MTRCKSVPKPLPNGQELLHSNTQRARTEPAALRSSAMPKTTETKPTWQKPELVRLGTIADVAGPAGAAAQSPIQTRS